MRVYQDRFQSDQNYRLLSSDQKSGTDKEQMETRSNAAVIFATHYLLQFCDYDVC